MTPNPFEVLQLDPAATEEDVVKRAAQLRQRGADEATVSALRQAVQALTGPAQERMLHSLLTPPAPVYEWPAIERFVAGHRRAPRSTGMAEPPETVELDLREFAALLRPVLAAELAYSPLTLEPSPVDEIPGEVLRQSVEGLWHGLPFDTAG